MSFFKKFDNKIIIIASISIILGLSSLFIMNKIVTADDLPSSTIPEMYVISDNEKVFVNGMIVPEQSQTFDPQANGTLEKLSVENGDIVKKGELLYSTFDQSILDEIDLFKEQLNTLKNSNIDNDPVVNVEINKLQGQISSLEKKSHEDISAPFDGKIYIDTNNDMLENDSPLITLISNTFYMKGQINEQDLSKLKVEDRCEILIFSNDKKVAGKISFISDKPSSEMGELNSSNKLSYYDINITFDNQDFLTNGFHTQASIELENESIKIPTSSIITDEENNSFVFISKDNILEKHQVSIISHGNEISKIKPTLLPNTNIIRYPDDEMNDGDIIDENTLDNEVVEGDVN